MFVHLVRFDLSVATAGAPCEFCSAMATLCSQLVCHLLIAVAYIATTYVIIACMYSTSLATHA